MRRTLRRFNANHALSSSNARFTHASCTRVNINNRVPTLNKANCSSAATEPGKFSPDLARATTQLDRFQRRLKHNNTHLTPSERASGNMAHLRSSGFHKVSQRSFISPGDKFPIGEFSEEQVVQPRVGRSMVLSVAPRKRDGFHVPEDSNNNMYLETHHHN